VALALGVMRQIHPAGFALSYTFPQNRVVQEFRVCSLPGLRLCGAGTSMQRHNAGTGLVEAVHDNSAQIVSRGRFLFWLRRMKNFRYFNGTLNSITSSECPCPFMFWLIDETSWHEMESRP